MPPCYIVNDYAQMRGGVMEFTGENRAKREQLYTDTDISNVTLLFSTLSNFQKMDPSIFTVWMNILRRFPQSKLMTIEYAGFETAMKNLRKTSQVHGIKPDRIPLSPQAPWIDHVNTTGLDSVWAGVPTVVLGGGATMPARAAESIAAGLESPIGVTYSLKDYEDKVT